MNVTNSSPQPRYRSCLPQHSGETFLTDGGLETTLIYLEDWDLPEFAAFVLLDSTSGSAALRDYYRTYLSLAQQANTGIVLESPTWRASTRWGEALGYDRTELARVNQQAIRQLILLREEYPSDLPIVVSGCVGPRDDGYQPQHLQSVPEAQTYHQDQVSWFADTQADMVCALTMTHVEEAVGIARAAERVSMPVAISFTVETDGRLPSGTTLADAIRSVDNLTQRYPVYYMVNCAHPNHFRGCFAGDESWMSRIRGIRANASDMSHAELDACTQLDSGDPLALASDYLELLELLPNLNVLGGCCGTDHRHLEAIAQKCVRSQDRLPANSIAK